MPGAPSNLRGWDSQSSIMCQFLSEANGFLPHRRREDEECRETHRSDHQPQRSYAVRVFEVFDIHAERSSDRNPINVSAPSEAMPAEIPLTQPLRKLQGS